MSRYVPQKFDLTNYDSGFGVRCFNSHPALKIGGFDIYGGSCSTPVIHDADIYVGLDMSMQRSAMQYPWESGVAFLFHIPDMGVPKEPEQFIKMVDWLAAQLLSGKKIHVGCIGGHGRTGMVLSALVAKVDGVVDAITYVRNNYCTKAVETQAQVKFLQTHFGITPVTTHKDTFTHGWDDTKVRGVKVTSKKPVTKNLTFSPAKSPDCIWSDNVTKESK